MAVCGFASTSSLRTSTTPAYLAASFSISGATMRHGPHHSAQKSTITGLSLPSTSVSNVASVTSGTLDDIRVPFVGVRRSAGDLLEQMVGVEDAVVGEPIEDRASLATAGDEASRAQHGQMLAHVRHLAAHVARQIADAPLAVGELLEHAQSLRIGQRSSDARRVRPR